MKSRTATKNNYTFHFPIFFVGVYVHEKPHCDDFDAVRRFGCRHVGVYVHEKPHCDIQLGLEGEFPRVGVYVHEKPHCDNVDPAAIKPSLVGVYVHEKPHCDVRVLLLEG